MRNIKQGDQIIASMHKEEAGYDKLIDIFNESIKVAENMMY